MLCSDGHTHGSMRTAAAISFPRQWPAAAGWRGEFTMHVKTMQRERCNAGLQVPDLTWEIERRSWLWLDQPATPQQQPSYSSMCLSALVGLDRTTGSYCTTASVAWPSRDTPRPCMHAAVDDPSVQASMKAWRLLFARQYNVSLSICLCLSSICCACKLHKSSVEQSGTFLFRQTLY